MFNLPATHVFTVDVIGEHESNIVAISARIKGGAVHRKTNQRISEPEQIRRIVNFWAFLLTNGDGKPRAVSWQYIQPGYTAYFFWANALLSRYCDFWGAE